MAQSIEARIQAATPPLREVEEKFWEGGGDVAVVKLRDQLCTLLEHHGLVTKMRMHSQYIGVHPRNRYGKGIVPNRVHSLLEGISSEGWSDKELDEPWASEMPPAGHDRETEFKNYNNDMTQQSAGLLPAYAEDGAQIKAVSVMCGHTSQTLRLVHHGVESTISSLTEEDGKLLLRKLREKDPEYADAVEQGLEWNIIRWQVEDAFPFIMDLVQEAGNASQALAQCESRAEIMLKLHASAVRLFADPKNLKDVDRTWLRVQAEALRGKPNFADEVLDLLKFVRSLSGGLESPTYLLALRDFQRSLKQSATVKGWLYANLAEVSVGGVFANAPDFRLACIKAALATDKVFPNGDQRLLTTADVTALKDRLAPLALQANDIIIKAQEIAQRFMDGPTQPLATSIIQVTEIRLVNHVFRKSDPLRGSFKSLQEIGYQFVQDLSTSTKTTIESPWCTTPKAAPKPDAEPAASSSAGVTSFSGGAVMNTLELINAKGYIVGKCAVRKSDGEWFDIIETSNDTITLKDSAGAQLTVFHASLMKGNFSVRQPLKGVETWADWFVNTNPTSFFEFQCDQQSCMVKLILASEYEKHKAVNSKLEIVTAPSAHKGVRAKEDFARGALVLVPLTKSIVWGHDPAAAPHGAVPVENFITNKDDNKVYRCYLLKTDVEPTEADDTDHGGYARSGFIAPFWRISHTTDEDKVNMSWKTVRGDLMVCGKPSGSKEVPLLHNIKAVKGGETLYVLKQRTSVAEAKATVHAKPKAKSRIPPKTVAPAAKRLRAAGR